MKPFILRTLLLLMIVAAIIILATPPVMRAQTQARKIKAISHLKNISIALREFDHEYGHCPGLAIPEELQKIYPNQNRSDSNYILGQLIASEYLEAEFLLYAGYDKSQADENTSSAEQILTAGECQMSCVSQINGKAIEIKNVQGETPLLLAFINPKTGKFDRDLYEGEAVYGKANGTVSTSKITKAGEAFWESKKKFNLLGPKWGEDTVTISHPLPY